MVYYDVDGDVIIQFSLVFLLSLQFAHITVAATVTVTGKMLLENGDACHFVVEKVDC